MVWIAKFNTVIFTLTVRSMLNARVEVWGVIYYYKFEDILFNIGANRFMIERKTLLSTDQIAR